MICRPTTKSCFGRTGKSVLNVEHDSSRVPTEPGIARIVLSVYGVKRRRNDSVNATCASRQRKWRNHILKIE